MDTGTILSLMAAYLGTPGLAWASAWLIGKLKRRMAYLRLKKDPLYDEGSKFACIMRGSHEVFGPCYVHSLQPGRVEVRGRVEENRRYAMSWSVSEFEGLDPVAEP